MAILYVDDDLLVRHTALMVLEEAGYTVHQAGTVAEAVSLLDRLAPEITHLLTDVRMPGWQDGIDLAEMVSSTYPHIKIIVLSGYNDHRSEALEQNAQFIPKPWTMRQVLTAVGYQA